MDKKDVTLYNGFAKSYKQHHIVHAYQRGGDNKTLCGREMVHASTEPYDRTVDGACKKCELWFAVDKRAHPGWPQDGVKGVGGGRGKGEGGGRGGGK